MADKSYSLFPNEHLLCEGLIRIEAQQLEPFRDLKHVFLVGNLQHEVCHPFVRDDRLEVILCYYEAGDDGLFHRHPHVTEYEYVLAGSVSYFDVATGQEVSFSTGDFCVIPAGICVQRRVRQRARTLALKVPSADDKVHCAECDRECAYRQKPFAGSSREGKKNEFF